MPNCFVPANILLPDENIPLSQWACLACDQFTSQPEYWQKAEALAEGKPSALHLVLPCSREEQTVRWSERQRAAYDCICREADSCEFIAESYTRDCMRLRNQRLVTLADCCICYCREPEGRTGTAQTVRMARHKGIPVINLALDETAQARAATDALCGKDMEY